MRRFGNQALLIRHPIGDREELNIVLYMEGLHWY